MNNAPNPAQSGDRQKAFTLDFFLCSISLMMLMLSSVYGTVAVVGFLLPWVIIVLMKRTYSAQILFKYWPLFLMPALCLLSALWSDDPIWTVKAAAELVATVIIGIWAGSLIPPRALIASLLTALTITAIICVVVAIGSGKTGLGAAPAMEGISGSKNAFCGMISVLFLSSICVAIDKGQSWPFRAMAFAVALCAPILLYLGHSVGTMLAVVLTVVIWKFIRFVGQFGRTLTYLVFTLAITLGIAVTIGTIVTDSNPMNLLGLVGKNSSLTGRTHLWEKASEMIATRPLQGTGYGAFWRVGNPAAEQLWFESFVPSGSGFNFHNEYVEMLVELGIIGLIIMLSNLVILTKRMLNALLGKISPAQTFASLMFLFLLFRTPVEVELFNQFGIGVILLCIIWIYLYPTRQPASAAQPTKFKIYNSSDTSL